MHVCLWLFAISYAGDYWIADGFGVRRVDAISGIITTRAVCNGLDSSGLYTCTDLSLGNAVGEVLTNDYPNVVHITSTITISTQVRCDVSSTQSFVVATTGMAVDSAGTVYVVSYGAGNCVCFSNDDGTTAGGCACVDGSNQCDALDALISSPDALTMGPDGNLYVVEPYGICIWQVAIASNVATVVYDIKPPAPPTLLYW